MGVDLSKFSVGRFNRGASVVKEAMWLLTNWLLFQLCPLKFVGVKCFMLRCFGARIGRGVVIKPHVKITFPWKLKLGDNVWLGEECWLLNLEHISIADNVCVSQRAFLCTGSHNYKLPTFDLIVQPITVEDGAWLGAGCWVGPGVRVGHGAVLSAGSVASADLEPWGIYRGNPAVFVRPRVISSTAQEHD